MQSPDLSHYPISDNASAFKIDVYMQALERMKIRALFTAPYSPTSNPDERIKGVQLQTMSRLIVVRPLWD